MFTRLSKMFALSAIGLIFPACGDPNDSSDTLSYNNSDGNESASDEAEDVSHPYDHSEIAKLKPLKLVSPSGDALGVFRIIVFIVDADTYGYETTPRIIANANTTASVLNLVGDVEMRPDPASTMSPKPNVPTIVGGGTTTVASAILRESYNKAVIDTTIVKLNTPVRYPSTGQCNPGQLMTQTDITSPNKPSFNSIVTSAGYNLANYEKFVVLMPVNFDPNATGRGNSNSSMVCGSTPNQRVIAHEMGHSLGFGHAGYYIGGGSGEPAEYSDKTSTMGSTIDEVFFNGTERLISDWITPTEHQLLTSTDSGTAFTLRALEASPASGTKKAYRVRTGNEEYVISFRQLTNYWNTSTFSSWINYGLNNKIYIEQHYTLTELSTANTRRVANLAPGECVLLPNLAATVEMTGYSGTNATVKVHYNLTPSQVGCTAVAISGS